jgi:UTP-glucose-1-phosphate uridylyltransferase
MKPTLVVLAAGMGSRYGGVKQIDPVGPAGQAIIDYSVYDAIRAGFDRVVFVIRTEIEEDVKEFFAGKFDTRINVAFVLQQLTDIPEGRVVPANRQKPWGTAHAVLAARKVVDAPFAVINADDFYGHNAFITANEYLSSIETTSTDYALIGYRLDTTLSEHGSVSRGIVSRDKEHWLTDVEEHTRIKATQKGIVSVGEGDIERARFDGSELVSMNLWGFSPVAMSLMWSLFDEFLESRSEEPKAEFYIPYAVNQMTLRGEARCKVIETSSRWFGVTYPQDRAAAVASIRNLVAANEYPESLWA